MLLRERCLKFDHEAMPWLAHGLYGYCIPDTHIRQDAVMALAIGIASIDNPDVVRRGGKVLPVLYF